MNFFNHPVLFRHAMNLWPPFLGAGIRVKYISPSWCKIIVDLRNFGLNSNYKGTHFGGSLFSMTDPFLMLMLIKNLGKQYDVWDKAAAIEFMAPTRKKATATFFLDEKKLEHIKHATAHGSKHFETFTVVVADQKGDAVAKVHKTIFVRKKNGTSIP